MSSNYLDPERMAIHAKLAAQLHHAAVPGTPHPGKTHPGKSNVSKHAASLEAPLSTTISQRDLRDAFGAFATGVTVVTAIRPDGEPLGVTANSFASVSLDPPLLLWCLAKSSSAVEAFALGAPFAVHILAHQQRDLAMHFARRSREKFEIDRAWRSNPAPPHIADALCRFECRVHSLCLGGDHLIIVGEVLALQRHSGLPLAFQGGHFGSFAADKGSPQVDTWQAWHGAWI